MKLLITGAAQPNECLLNELNRQGWKVHIHPHESDPVEDPEQYDAVVCNGLFLYTPITSFSNLKTIQLTSAGLDRVPLDYIRQHGLTLFNARGVYSVPMAEWAIANILSIYKDIPEFAINQQKTKWIKRRHLRELSSACAAIVGAGNIGTEVARRLKAFGTSVVGFDVNVNYTNPAFDSIQPVELFKPDKYDIIIITAPHTDATHHLFNKSALETMRDGAVLIAMSRGNIVDEDALAEVLSNRPSLSAVLDVFAVEPLPENSPLWRMKNIHIFPHNSFVGENNTSRLHQLIISNLSLLTQPSTAS